MGACCGGAEVKETKNKLDHMVRRKSTILFENFSKQTDYRKKYEIISILGN